MEPGRLATVGFPGKFPIPLKPAQYGELSQLLRRLVNCGVSLKLPAYHPLIGPKVDHDVILGQGPPKCFLRAMYVVEKHHFGMIRPAMNIDLSQIACAAYGSCAHVDLEGSDKYYTEISDISNHSRQTGAPHIPLSLS